MLEAIPGQPQVSILEPNDSQFRTIIESVPNGIIMASLDGQIVIANSEIEKMFGYKQVELIGQSVDLLVPLRFREKHPTYRKEFSSHPSKRQMGAGRDLAGRKKNGDEIPVEIGLNYVKARDGTFIIASIVDITERKKQEEKFRTIVEAVPSGIVMIDSKGTIVLSNTETERMFGYNKGELVGNRIEVLVPERIRNHHPDLRKQFGTHPQKRQMGAGRDLTGQKKDGSEIPVEIGLNPIETDSGHFVVASIVDITERKYIETKLHNAYEEVQQKNEEMEQFVYTVSHDLKSPLVTSMSFLGFLREDLKEQKMDDVLDSIERLEKAHHRMQELINDLLQLSRVGRMGLQIEMTPLSEVLSGVTDSLLESLHEKNIKTILPSDLPAIFVDRRRIFQVFENLFNNAIKYGMDTSDPRIEVQWKDNGDELLVAVKDYGAGIDPQYHKKIFGLFQRLHNDGEGTGVGLAIVSRIMQLHGGRVWIESDIGQGAQFWLAFPKQKVSEPDDKFTSSRN